MDLDEFIKIIKEGDISHIQKFVRKISDKVNQTNSKGKTYLMVASELGNTDATKSLIDCGADLDKRDEDGETALHYAVRGNHKDVVSKIISAGADFTIGDGYGDTPLHLAARWSNKDVVEIILKAKGGYTLKINQINNRRVTPLHLAVRKNNPDVVSTILSAGADLAIADGDGNTPLHWAAWCGNKDVVEIILKAIGRDTLKINQINNRRVTPLHLAVDNNNPDIVSKLISASADLTIGDGDGNTPLHLAAWWGNKDVVKIILKGMGGDTLKINQINNLGSTPLHRAVARNHKGVVSTITTAGADLTIGDNKGNTPLHWAAWWGNKDVVGIILKAMGGDTLKDPVKLDIKNHDGKTPLHLAVSEGHFAVIRRLISQNAEINSVDDVGNNCLHLAVDKDTFHCEGESLDILDKYCTNLGLSRTKKPCGAVVASYLADKGANLYHRNNNKKTPLDLIRNPELKEKIEVFFPPPCMFCENNQPTITFQSCGHIVICGECSVIALKRCPKCQECIISKTGFETSESNDKEVQTMPQPVETSESNDKEVQTMPQPVETSESNDKEVQTMPQPVEMQKLQEKDLLKVAKQLGSHWWQLGIYLGITTTDLNNIKSDYPNETIERSYQMLYKWFTSCDPETCTVDTLRKALKEAECSVAL